MRPAALQWADTPRCSTGTNPSLLSTTTANSVVPGIPVATLLRPSPWSAHNPGPSKTEHATAVWSRTDETKRGNPSRSDTSRFDPGRCADPCTSARRRTWVDANEANSWLGPTDGKPGDGSRLHSNRRILAAHPSLAPGQRRAGCGTGCQAAYDNETAACLEPRRNPSAQAGSPARSRRGLHPAPVCFNPTA